MVGFRSHFICNNSLFSNLAHCLKTVRQTLAQRIFGTGTPAPALSVLLPLPEQMEAAYFKSVKVK